MRSRPLTFIAALALVLVLAPAAHAARTVIGPGMSGDFNFRFPFSGSGWQGNRLMTVNYYESEATTKPTKAFSFTVAKSGKWSFGFTNPVVNVSQGRTAKLCFVQNDSRTKKTYTRCAPFYVQPANARAEPDSVKLGESVLLHVAGWAPGTGLTLDFIRPGGVVDTATATTRSKSAFVNMGQPFGNVFIPAGGAAVTVTIAAGSPTGVYSVFVHRPSDSVGSRTAFNVTA